MSSFQIRTSYAERVNAAAWIHYRGYIISMSTIPSNPELVVFKEDDEGIDIKFGTHTPNMEGIIAAKEYIDSIVEPKE